MPTSKMPPELFVEFKALSDELTWLSASWDSFLQLFGTDQGQFALLNLANGFFAIARLSILNSVFLGICRFTDPPEDSRSHRDNLTLGRLVEAATKHHPLSCDEELRTAESAASPFRSWRNRRIAHADLQTALNLKPDLLPTIPHADVTFAIWSIGEVLNRVQVAFDETRTHYDHVIVPGDASQMLELLKLAVAHQECIQREWDSGRESSCGPAL